MLKLMDRGRIAIIQALAQIVSAQMGGAVADERNLVRGWQKSSQKLKRKYRSAVYPIGKLKVGLSRHRAFLYKVLADGLNLGCRLVRGFPYHPNSSQAVALVIIDKTEVIVDLLVQPGRLLKLEDGGPDDPGVQVVYAEAPGMPSEPYWVPCTYRTHMILLAVHKGVLCCACISLRFPEVFKEVPDIPGRHLCRTGCAANIL